MKTYTRWVKRTLEGIVMSTAMMLSCAAVPQEEIPNMSKYWNNSYDIKKVVRFEDVFGRTGFSIQNSGTAFVIQKGINSYFVTNRHVVEHPFLSEVPKGLTVKSIFYSVDPNNNDSNIDDDYKVILVGVDNDSDIAILKYTPQFSDMANELGEKIIIDEDYVPSPQILNHKTLGDLISWIGLPSVVGTGKVGDDVFTVGYLSNFPKSLIKGYITTNTQKDSQNGKIFWTSIDALPGLSGGPLYVIDSNNNVVLAGVCTASTKEWNYTMVVDIKEVTGLLERIKNNPQKEEKYLEHRFGVEYQFLNKH